MVEAEETLVLTDRAALLLFHDYAEGEFASLFCHDSFGAPLRANIRHVREIAAGFHGSYGVENRRSDRRAGYPVIEARRSSHQLEPFQLALFTFLQTFDLALLGAQYKFENHVSANCDGRRQQDPHQELDIELDLKRREACAQQRRNDQYKQSVDYFAPNRVHRTAFCGAAYVSSGKRILWTATIRLSVSRSICRNCSTISLLGGSQNHKTPAIVRLVASCPAVSKVMPTLSDPNRATVDLRMAGATNKAHPLVS